MKKVSIEKTVRIVLDFWLPVQKIQPLLRKKPKQW